MTTSTRADGIVALYLRISKDRAGRAESIADQEVLGRAYAETAWPGRPVEVWADNAITAADQDVDRPGYQALRSALAEGRIAHLWTVEQTRLQRTEVGWFRLAAELVAAGVAEVHTHRDGIVRVGDEVAGIKAVLAAAEVRRLKARILDKHARLGAQGRPSGGRQFGYRTGRNELGEATLEVVDEEAAHIRWAAEAILSGWSLRSVALGLNERGATLVRGGKRWTTNHVRSLLRKPSVAGLREHRGELVRATWPPILDETTWRQLSATLATRATVIARDGATKTVHRTTGTRAPRRYLLTGIALCGRCGAPLRGAPKQARRPPAPKVPYYQCTPPDGCMRIGILGEPLEAHVRDLLLAELDRREAFEDALNEDTTAARRAELGAAIVGIEDRHVDLARRWAAGDLPAPAWDAARSALDAERARLDAELAALPAPGVRLDAGELRAGWDLMTLEERRHVLRLYLTGIRIAPAGPVPRFDPGRVTPIWREVGQESPT